MPARARLVVTLLALIAATAWAADPLGHWRIGGPLTVTACRGSDCKSYHASSVGGAFVGSPDGSFVTAPLLSTCALPNLTGTWRAGSHPGRFKLVPSNGAAVRKALAKCNGLKKLHGGFKSFFEPNADGLTASGRMQFRGRAIVQGTNSKFVATTRFSATRGSPSGAFVE
jgi:hypothetical protein